MVRNYQPRNPLDPGSKLKPEKTLGIIHYLLVGREAAWIAQKEEVSKNTVSAISAKLRRKLRSSAAIRQAFFEPFYVQGVLSRDAYTHFIDEPTDTDFFTHVAACALHCPAEFSNKAANWSRFLRGGGRRVLNLGQTQKFVDQAFRDGEFRLRAACATCRVMPNGPINKPEFYATLGVYLRARNLREANTQDYYLLYAVFYLLHFITLHKIGISWNQEEIQFPPETDWQQLPKRYVEAINAFATELIAYVLPYLLEDNLKE